MSISRSKKRKRRGSVLITAIAFIIMLCMLAAVTVDMGHMYGCLSRMQNAADSAALAAAMRVGNENTQEARDDAQKWAIGFANYNLPGHGDVLVTSDVTFGTWDPEFETFSAGGTTPNAVQVQVRRDGANTDSVGTWFISMFGPDSLGLMCTAIAMTSPTSAAEGVPMALRSPSFGSVDPAVTAVNPGKDGPSFPKNGVSFKVGEHVVIAAYGQGKKPPVHLTLDVDADGPGAAEADVKKILKGDMDPVELQAGDEVNVFNEGTGSAGYIEALDDRLNLADSDPGRDIVMAVIETTSTSRDADGKLTGPVRIADFVCVHIDGIVDIVVVDPTDPTKTITDRVLMGTITNKRAETFWGGATPSGAGGATVTIAELVR